MSNLLLKINNITIIVCFSLFSYTAIANKSTSFEDVYAKAAEVNLDIIENKISKEAAEAKFDSLKANFLPRLGLEGRYENFKSNLEKIDGATANVYIDWNFFNGFKDSVNKKNSKIEFNQAESLLKRSEKNFRSQILVYYSHSQALQKIIETYKYTIAKNKMFLANVSLRKKSGLVSESDYLEFELYDQKLKLELNDYESQFELSIAELKVHSGISEFGTLSTVLKPKMLNINFNDIETLLFSETSQLKVLQNEIIKSENDLEFSNSAYYPKLNLRATYGSQGLREAVVNPETTVTLYAQWELFSGFETLALRRLALTKISLTKNKLNVEKIHLKSDVDQKLKKISNILERLNLEEANKLKSENYVKAVTNEFRRGVKNSADLKNAVELLLQIDINAYQLKSEYYKTLYDLQTILGVQIEEK